MDAKRTRIYWLCQLVGWFTYTGFWLVQALYSGPAGVAPVQLVAVSGGSTLLSIAWTHAFRQQIRRRAWALLSPLRLLPRTVAGSLVIGPAIAVSSIPLSLVYGDAAQPLTVWLPRVTAICAFNVLLWSVVYFGVHYFEGWRQAERDKLELAVSAAETKLHVLISQLNPHFLFNCLNSVRALIAEDPARAHTAVTALSKLIRYSLQATRVATVPLEAELDMVTTYLMLEGIRFEERLRCEIEVAPETRAVQVPPMLVQSLVENGVKHGIERLPAGGTIAVASWLEGDALRVRVRNSGRLGSPVDGDSPRVGLHNARERLRLLYGPRASLAMREAAGAVVAELSVPISRGAR